MGLVFIDGSTPYLTTAENLDIVKDYEYLAGTFPENVDFKFVYYSHDVDSPAAAGTPSVRLYS
jgi:hypothetical protein